MTRKLVAKDPSLVTPEALKLLAEARARFPELDKASDEEMLPRVPRRATCRICGLVADLTKEHIPPKSAFNKDRGVLHSFQEYLARDDKTGAMPGGEVLQGGIWGYTLCAGCNNFTGHRYVPEYTKWAVSAFNALAEAKTNVRRLDEMTEQPRGRISMGGTPAPKPGSFVREALAVMSSLSVGFDMPKRFPAVRRIILGPSVEALPEGVSLGLGLFLVR